VERRLTAVFAADMVGYSLLVRKDEAGTIAAMRQLLVDLFEPHISDYGGRIVKRMGDGFLAEFGSVVDAVSCGAGIQQRIAARNALLSADQEILFRIGVNLGDVVVDGDDIQGDGVNIAARLESLSEPGGMCVSDAVNEQVRDRLKLNFEDFGNTELKNIDRPVRVWKWTTEIGTKDPAKDRQAIGSASAKLAIAVLPFNNMSDDPEQEYFSDGIAEDVITDLSKVSELLVIARNSTFAYKGKAVNAQQICSELSARYLVEGSVRKAGNRIRVTAQLIDGSTGGHLWADRYDRDLMDVFAVQDEITENIVKSLKVALTPIERQALHQTPTKNPKAYDFYLRGRNFLHEMTKENLERARRMFSKARELDQEYAFALAGIADCDSLIYFYYASERGLINSAMNCSRKAVQLAPQLAETHASLGLALCLEGDETGGELEFEAAIKLDPMHYESYWYLGLVRVIKGDFDRSALLFQEASRVRGDDLQSMMMTMGSLNKLGDQSKTQAAAMRTFNIADRQFGLNPGDSRAAYIGAVALIYLDRKPEAFEWANIAAEIDSSDSRTTYNLACVFSLLEKPDKALDMLEMSIRGGRPIRMKEWANIDPELSCARHEPGFRQLMELWDELAS
jgi:adenylate cyclase